MQTKNKERRNKGKEQRNKGKETKGKEERISQADEKSDWNPATHQVGKHRRGQVCWPEERLEAGHRTDDKWSEGIRKCVGTIK